MKTRNQQLLMTFQSEENKIDFFRKQDNVQKVFLLENLPTTLKKDLLISLHESEIIEFSSILDPDEFTDILQFLSKKKQKRIIFNLNNSLKEHVNYLLKFTPESAAGIMNINYIIIEIDTSQKQIIQRIKKHVASGKKEPTILIVDRFRHLLGELRISSILLHENLTTLYSNLKQLSTISYNEDQEECIHLFKQHKHEKIVVTDENENVMGLIHAKDIFKIIEQENTEDFYGLAGVNKEEDITDGVM